MEYGYIEIGRGKRVDKAAKAISQRKQLKEDLEKRSGELIAQADRIRRSDPVKARILHHRGIVLADEAYRMTKENKQGGMTVEQLERSAVLARLALTKEG